MSSSSSLHACPSCGFQVFGEGYGSYEICPLCDWEDDGVQLANPASGGGANHESLLDYQKRSLASWPVSISEHSGYQRSPAWRPLGRGESLLALAVQAAEHWSNKAVVEPSEAYWALPGEAERVHQSNGVVRISVNRIAWARFDSQETVEFDGKQTRAVILDPGMGPVRYLALDGRFLVNGSFWEGEDPMASQPVRAATLDEACTALVIGAEKQKYPELLDYLPLPQSEVVVCPTCKGKRRQQVAEDFGVICHECSGRGWTRASE